jgi:uncharacterized iron-regulated protein
LSAIGRKGKTTSVLYTDHLQPRIERPVCMARNQVMVYYHQFGHLRFELDVIRKVFYFFVMSIFMLGCAMAPQKLFVEDLSKSFPPDTIISASTGQPISFDELINDLARIKVIYIGEKHTDPAHHEIQFRIIKEIFKTRPNVVIGLEMVDHTYQVVLDQWSTGQLNPDRFLEKIHWYANWRFDFELYQNIFFFIKNNNIRIVGLNIPFHIAPKIRVGGIETLSDNEKKYLPKTIDTSNEAHRAHMESKFKQHQAMSKAKFPSFDYFYMVQCVWEDGMAETIANNLGDDAMIVLAGNGHIVHKFGIPERAFNRTKAAFKTVYLASASSRVDLSYADYIWVTPLKTKHD